ncbi:MAG: ABC transporter ATP-binding protein/permease [Enterococcus aquimarinus]|uniref:ABC transporter ATP-binding protein/permease n=1 Tax=Enterococcus aquimarinus TaxID=328396 RepID=A0A9E3ZUV5_9ENTE|nr:ABC transporter ATP-binding protein/permease [Enterococcus aquimarinus]
MFRIFKRSSTGERLLFVLSIIFILVQVNLELKIPSYMAEITTLLQTPGTVTADILKPGFTMIGLSLLSFASAILVGFFAARIAAGLITRLRRELFNRVTNYSTNEIQHFSVPSLVTRTTNDLTQIQMLIAMGLQVIIKGPITAIWAITKISNKSWEWTATTAVAVIFLLFTISILMIFVRPKFAMIQKLTDNLNSVTRESLTGLRVIRAYNAKGYQEEKFEKANEELTAVNLFTGRMMSILNPVMTLVSSGLTLAVYVIGAFLIQNALGADKINLFSDMVVFTAYAMQVVMGFMMMTMIFFILPRAVVSSNRINEVLDLFSSVTFTKEKMTELPKKGTIEFKNVTFAYPNAAESVLNDITFTANTGETVAFIGSTGSGKSTILKLIPRLFDTTEGEIVINGQNVKNFDHETLNNIIGYIPQKPVLFAGDIRSNMELGTSAATPLDDAAIFEALEIAQAKDFVENEEGQLAAPVAQAGSNFSGGQKQRLAISRVIARQPEILLFDDSFSALDYQTDKKLRGILKERLPQTTKLIVAQRISTIMDANLIIVLDEGRIVGKGTHQELLKDNEVYQEIAYSQLSKEELVNE